MAGAFRVASVFFCCMHFLARFYEPILKAVCGEGGLGKVTLTQLLFQISHVIQRDFDAFKVLNVDIYIALTYLATLIQSDNGQKIADTWGLNI
jgi:hypothetical protein